MRRAPIVASLVLGCACGDVATPAPEPAPARGATGAASATGAAASAASASSGSASATAALSAAPSASGSAGPRGVKLTPETSPDPNLVPWPAGYTPPLVWETRKVRVDDVEETWSLRFKQAPRLNGCAPWSGCYCDGLEWGVMGDLELVRERPGAPVETLSLGDLRGGLAQIKGFARQPKDEGVYDAEGNEKVPPARLEEVVKRPHPSTLALADYDHDGRATEFVFPIDYWACGQSPSVLVGISRRAPELHVFSPANKPDALLEMVYLSSWDKLLRASGRTLALEQVACGDHGGGGEFERWEIGKDGAISVFPDDGWECDMSASPPRRRRRAATH